MPGTLDRIKEFIDFKGLSVSSFEKTTKFSNGAFASQLKNNKTIGVDKLENILNAFPELNPTWLLTGNGKMIANDVLQEVNEPGEEYGASWKELAETQRKLLEVWELKISMLESQLKSKAS